MIWWILLAVLVAGAVFALRGRASVASRRLPARTGARAAGAALKATGRSKPPSEAIDDYRGAMLFPQKDCCEAILKLRGRTFPRNTAPTIPVPGCDRESCGCQLHQVTGRRRGPRRLVPDRRDDVRFTEDRRTGKDRRSGVDIWKQNP